MKARPAIPILGARLVRRLQVAALSLTLAALLIALQFVLKTTGGTLFLFTMAALALSGRQEEKGRNLITCKLKPDHNADVPADGEVHPYSNRFLGTYFSDFLNNRFIDITKFFQSQRVTTLFAERCQGPHKVIDIFKTPTFDVLDQFTDVFLHLVRTLQSVTPHTNDFFKLFNSRVVVMVCNFLNQPCYFAEQFFQRHGERVD